MWVARTNYLSDGAVTWGLHGQEAEVPTWNQVSKGSKSPFSLRLLIFIWCTHTTSTLFLVCSVCIVFLLQVCVLILQKQWPHSPPEQATSSVLLLDTALFFRLTALLITIILSIFFYFSSAYSVLTICYPTVSWLVIRRCQGCYCSIFQNWGMKHGNVKKFLLPTHLTRSLRVHHSMCQQASSR